ncbi:MAG: GNAT family N-acetyltransferase [Candidatus Hodarchaeales archaeon]
MFKLAFSRLEDIDSISNLAFAEMDEILRAAWNTPKFDWEGWKVDLRIALTDENERVFTISVSSEENEEEELGGFLWYNFTEDSEIWLTTLIVASRFQGRGIGSSVLSLLEEEARKKGIDRIELGVQKVNVKAIEFYKNRGFRELEEIKYAGTAIMRKMINRETSAPKEIYS